MKRYICNKASEEQNGSMDIFCSSENNVKTFRL